MINETYAPKYIVDFSRFRENCHAVMDAFDREWNANIVYGYSVKTNRDAQLINYALKKMGWFIEMVSPDEFDYCKALGVPFERMILNGPCKERLISKECPHIKYINLDNLDEVVAFCAQNKIDSNVGLRINFDLESICPKETTAGDEVSRFGIDADSEDLSIAIEHLLDAGYGNIGIHLHTSTTSRSLNVFKALAQEAVKLKKRYGIDFSFIDIGGGFFGGQVVQGKPCMHEYAETICNELKVAFNPEKTKLILEPGASVLATSVSYRTEVINTRFVRNVKVITLSGTLLHVNPFMAQRNQAFDILGDSPLRQNIDKQIICGSTCMENDRFATIINSEEINKGDVLVFYNVGAYTMAFNSHFILNPPAVEYIGE